MIAEKAKSAAALTLILAACSALLWAKCPVSWVEVHGQIQCSFKPDDKVLVTLLFARHQIEGTGEETALDLHNGSFEGRVVFDTLSSSRFPTGDRCKRRPISALIRLISADGTERDRKVLRFPDGFDYAEKDGLYMLRSSIVLSGRCEPKKCPNTVSSPCSDPQ